MRKPAKMLLSLLLSAALILGLFPALAEDAQPLTIDNVRQYVVGVEEPVTLEDGTTRPLINFDNAATTPALRPVMDEVNDKLLTYGSIGRGFSKKSDISTELYNETRNKVLSFVGLDPKDYTYTMFYVDNTTDGFNKLATALINSSEDIVLTTRMEHHANDLPWRERSKVVGSKVLYAEVDEKGRVIYEDLERQLKENKVKYVSVTAASNVTGYMPDVHRIAKLAHQYGARIIVDGAQIVAHRAFSMLGNTPEENIDFFVFSAHKMYSPYGGGAVIGLSSVLDVHQPAFYGGGTVHLVRDYEVEYKSGQEAYEAGSPNYPGVVGLGKAIDVLQQIGFDKIAEHEQQLTRRMVEGLQAIPNVTVYGDTEDLDSRVGVVSFNTSEANSYELASRMAEKSGVATRRGAFCAHPYVWRLMGYSDEEMVAFEGCNDFKTPGLIRVSFGIYNTEEEVDEFLKVLKENIEAIKVHNAELNAKELWDDVMPEEY